jgi:hypothetical protein
LKLVTVAFTSFFHPFGGAKEIMSIVSFCANIVVLMIVNTNNNIVFIYFVFTVEYSIPPFFRHKILPPLTILNTGQKTISIFPIENAGR